MKTPEQIAREFAADVGWYVSVRHKPGGPWHPIRGHVGRVRRAIAAAIRADRAQRITAPARPDTLCLCGHTQRMHDGGECRGGIILPEQACACTCKRYRRRAQRAGKGRVNHGR